MINLNQVNVSRLTKEEAQGIAVLELKDYKEARQVNKLSDNIRQVKVLEALERRLQYFSMSDPDVLAIRNEIKDLLNMDVYKTQNKPLNNNTVSYAVQYKKAMLRSK